MASKDLLLDGNHFIVLDVLDTVSDNCITTKYPFVQIVDSSIKYSFQNVKAIKSRIESTIKFEEKREDLFTITLNTAEDYKNHLFR
ncbi:MAG: hypothetical protein EHM44_00535 [Ignavibacteriales bacterium]|nr:MAG: hypothetical protein EHM44_00535 [Ignavibacteriales bacterium]